MSGMSLQPKRQNNTVYLLVDCSSSMGGSGKMSQAKRGALGFFGEALNKGYSVGLIKFASEAKLLAEPEKALGSIRAVVETLQPSGSTHMADAIRLANTWFADRVGLKTQNAICIVTDGMPDSREETLSEAEKAKSRGIDILTIGTNDADRAFLALLASRDELSLVVESKQLADGIERMAKMLPGMSEIRSDDE